MVKPFEDSLGSYFSRDGKISLDTNYADVNLLQNGLVVHLKMFYTTQKQHSPQLVDNYTWFTNKRYYSLPPKRHFPEANFKPPSFILEGVSNKFGRVLSKN
jgi:hypothetical protein